MSGHSKWHTIKHKKGALDAKRGRIFTRIIKELTVAARVGGGDPAGNPRLRTVIAEAKAVNMPNENIQRAIRRGTGEEEGVAYEEITYEGYGPGGAAVIIETLTDNRNRTVGELRHLLSKHGGNLGESNSVAWMFDRKGYIVVEKSAADEEALMAAALEAGADDMNEDGDNWEITTDIATFDAVLEAVRNLSIEPVTAKRAAMLPKSTIKLEGKTAQQMLKLMDALDDHDDVQQVWSNFDIEEKELEASLA
jgi:YebC/PmpR family DNA-binding regulatory protein